MGESEYVVLRLCNELQSGHHKIFFDNLFSSSELMTYLMERELYAVATLRANRRDCPIPAEKDMKKEGRETMEEFIDA